MLDLYFDVYSGDDKSTTLTIELAENILNSNRSLALPSAYNRHDFYSIFHKDSNNKIYLTIIERGPLNDYWTEHSLYSKSKTENETYDQINEFNSKIPTLDKSSDRALSSAFSIEIDEKYFQDALQVVSKK